MRELLRIENAGVAANAQGHSAPGRHDGKVHMPVAAKTQTTQSNTWEPLQPCRVHAPISITIHLYNKNSKQVKNDTAPLETIVDQSP
jgi:hypothetical protein